MRTLVASLVLCLAFALSARAEDPPAGYSQAPASLRAIFEAPLPPSTELSPTGADILLSEPRVYPPITELAEPMLQLAGIRLLPRNRAAHGAFYRKGLSLVHAADNAVRPVALPKGARVSGVRWNHLGTALAFNVVTDAAIELWVLDVKTARARRIPNVRLNNGILSTHRWARDGKTLIASLVPARQKPAPVAPLAPPAPRIETSAQVAQASSTYEARDLLKTPHDADLFEYYGTSQLALVDSKSGRVTLLGKPDTYTGIQQSPDQKYWFVTRIKRPYSFTRTYGRFPTVTELWDAHAKVLETLADLPLADQVPVDGVRVGPRGFEWHPTEPATIIWHEALDGGDTYAKVPAHDRIMIRPVGGMARELTRTKQRSEGLAWLDDGVRYVIWEVDQDQHRETAALLSSRSDARIPFWDRNYDDSYGDPGHPMYRVLPNGSWVIDARGETLSFQGNGASPVGERPFLDKWDLSAFNNDGTPKRTRLFRSAPTDLEYVLGWADDARTAFFTNRQSLTVAPHVERRVIGAPITATDGEAAFASTAAPVTEFKDPLPEARKITKQLVTYKRKDGLPLSFVLYLPPDYKPGTRLPTIVWAYPLDYTDRNGAGQVTAAPQAYTTLYASDLALLTLAGYAVLDDTAMPVVGPTKGAYDSFLEQLEWNAEAAINKAVEMGVTDRNRVGVIGHSHGAMMTANLLAWTDLFRAGVARSGAFNHTLRPFGFQNERRTLYEAKSTYLRISPTLNADRINEPLLIIHGEKDANPGTTPYQSERLFEAVRGTGGTVRMVVLPHENHGYTARESLEQLVAETVGWFDKYVKNAAPRGQAAKKAAK